MRAGRTEAWAKNRQLAKPTNTWQTLQNFPLPARVRSSPCSEDDGHADDGVHFPTRSDASATRDHRRAPVSSTWVGTLGVLGEEEMMMSSLLLCPRLALLQLPCIECKSGNLSGVWATYSRQLVLEARRAS